MITTIEDRAEAVHILLTAPGRLGPAIADELRTRLSVLAADDPATVTVVDLSAVTFMDCAGLGPLAMARPRLGSRLLPRSLGPPALRLLDLTRLLHREPHPSQATHHDALTGFALVANDARPVLEQYRDRCNDVGCCADDDTDRHCSGCAQDHRIPPAPDATRALTAAIQEA